MKHGLIGRAALAVLLCLVLAAPAWAGTWSRQWSVEEEQANASVWLDDTALMGTKVLGFDPSASGVAGLQARQSFAKYKGEMLQRQYGTVAAAVGDLGLNIERRYSWETLVDTWTRAAATWSADDMRRYLLVLAHDATRTDKFVENLAMALGNDKFSVDIFALVYFKNAERHQGAGLLQALLTGETEEGSRILRGLVTDEQLRQMADQARLRFTADPLNP